MQSTFKPKEQQVNFDAKLTQTSSVRMLWTFNFSPTLNQLPERVVLLLTIPFTFPSQISRVSFCAELLENNYLHLLSLPPLPPPKTIVPRFLAQGPFLLVDVFGRASYFHRRLCAFLLLCTKFSWKLQSYRPRSSVSWQESVQFRYAILLRCKLHQKLPSVTYRDSYLTDNFFRCRKRCRK